MVAHQRGFYACIQNYQTTDIEMLCCSSSITSPIVTLVVGRDQRVFAAHEDVLSLSPYFAAALKGQFLETSAKQVDLPDEYDPCYSHHLTILTDI